MNGFVNEPVSASVHFLNVTIKIKSKSTIVARICHINNAFVSLKQNVVKKFE